MEHLASAARNLEGKTVLITGASSGIGRSTAFEFARTAPHNLKLILTARRVDRLEGISRQIRDEIGEGVKVCVKQLDVSQPHQVEALVDSLPEDFRQINVLVNNAYVLHQLKSRFRLIPSQRLHVWRRASTRHPAGRYSGCLGHKCHWTYQHDTGCPANFQDKAKWWSRRHNHVRKYRW